MGRDLSLENAWRDRIEQQSRSGLTIQKFCDRERLVPHQFSWWKGELNRRSAASGRGRRAAARRRRKPRADRTTDFVSVQVERATDERRSIEIIVDEPLRIAVASGFDHQLLAEVVRVLENRRC